MKSTSWVLLAASFVVPAVVDSSLKATILLIAAAAVAFAMRRCSAARKHAVWVAAVVAVLALPVVAAMLPQWRVLPDLGFLGSSEARDDTAARIDEINSLAPAALADPDSQTGFDVAMQKVATTLVPASSAPQTWNSFVSPITLLGVWLAGALVCYGRIGLCCYAQRRLRRRSDEVTSGPIWEACDSIRRRLGVSTVRLLVGNQHHIPMAWGIFRPCVFLPEQSAEWSSERLRAVLLHELGHIARRDPLWQWLVQIACGLHWFNPLVWLASWRIHVERERACDDAVVSSGVSPENYAEHLLRLASGFECRGMLPLGGLAMARPQRLEGRLLALLDRNRDRRGVSRTLSALILVAAAGVSLPLAMLQSANGEPDAAAQGADQPEHRGGDSKKLAVVE